MSRKRPWGRAGKKGEANRRVIVVAHRGPHELTYHFTKGYRWSLR